MALPRRALDALTAGFCRLLLRIFFREIEVTGLARVPRGVPLVIVANHVNNLLDPMLLLAFLGAQPRFLAKHTLWRHPVVLPFLALAGAIPVYRPKEADASRNLETFARCVATLAGGHAVALFPEGLSHDEASLQPLKTGAARMVLQAERSHPGLGVRVLPVGLVYEAKDRFRSRVRVQVGQPVDPGPDVATHVLSRPAAVRSLTGRIASGLGAVVTPYPTAEKACLQAPVARPRWPVMVLAAAWLGAALNWLPYKIPGWAASTLGSTPGDRATYKLFAALFAFPLFWLLGGLLVGLWAGPRWGVAAALMAPVAARAGLHLFERRERAASALRRKPEEPPL